MYAKDHLTSDGFTSILGYYRSINLGMSSAVSVAFPNICEVKRDIVSLPTDLNPQWVSGFTARRRGIFYWH
jgi:hypothetical protein